MSIPLAAVCLFLPLAAHAQTGSSPFDTGLKSIKTLFTGTIDKVCWQQYDGGSVGGINLGFTSAQTMTNAAVLKDVATQPGTWDMLIADWSIVRADGTVVPMFTAGNPILGVQGVDTAYDTAFTASVERPESFLERSKSGSLRDDNP